MKEILPLAVLAVLFIALITFNRRNRERSARAAAARRERLHPGSEVMTTSGLYATVVAVTAEDDTALLSIAPGVEVKWAIAALREVAELPQHYRETEQRRQTGQPGAVQAADARPEDLPGSSDQPNG